MTHSLSTRVRASILLIVSVLMAGLVLTTVRAQEASRVELSFSPQIIEFSANPGDETVENVIRLTNGSDVQMEITTNALNFLAGGEDGEPELTEDSTSFSLAEWVTITPEAYTIAPGESYDFTVAITVPANAEPGGHFGAVELRGIPPQDPSNPNQVGQQFNVTPLILVSVAGEITEEANIESFEAAKSFFSAVNDDNPITIETRINNTGNVHFKPRGTVTITNMFGKEVTKIPLAEKNVLPDSIRKISTEWSDPGFAVGRYTAEVSFVYGDDDTILTSSTTFIVFPYQTILPVLLVTVLAVVILVKFRSRIGMAIKVLSGK